MYRAPSVAARRAAAWLAPCAAVAALLAGCASTSTRSDSGSASSCLSSVLRVALNDGAIGVGSGSSYVPIEFTNTAASSCSLRGYPKVAFVTGVSGQPIGATGVRYPGMAVHTVMLAPGAKAHAWLVVAAATNYPQKVCHPVTANWLRIRLPGQADYSYLQHTFPTCAQVSLGGGRILSVLPVQAGPAKRGTV
jgi:Protein of unknown function (DUF4232)